MEPVPGDPWHSVPFSRGHVLEPVRGAPLKLCVCPDMACPIQAHPENGQFVSVTGELKETIQAGSGTWSSFGSKSSGHLLIQATSTFPWPDACANTVQTGRLPQLRTGGNVAAAAPHPVSG